MASKSRKNNFKKPYNRFKKLSQKIPRTFPEFFQKVSKIPKRLPESSGKAPGQDLAKNGRFAMVPEGTFNCQPGSSQMAKI